MKVHGQDLRGKVTYFVTSPAQGKCMYGQWCIKEHLHRHISHLQWESLKSHQVVTSTTHRLNGPSVQFCSAYSWKKKWRFQRQISLLKPLLQLIHLQTTNIISLIFFPTSASLCIFILPCYVNLQLYWCISLDFSQQHYMLPFPSTLFNMSQIVLLLSHALWIRTARKLPFP